MYIPFLLHWSAGTCVLKLYHLPLLHKLVTRECVCPYIHTYYTCWHSAVSHYSTLQNTIEFGKEELDKVVIHWCQPLIIKYLHSACLQEQLGHYHNWLTSCVQMLRQMWEYIQTKLIAQIIQRIYKNILFCSNISRFPMQVFSLIHWTIIYRRDTEIPRQNTTWNCIVCNSITIIINEYTRSNLHINFHSIFKIL